MEPACSWMDRKVQSFEFKRHKQLETNRWRWTKRQSVRVLVTSVLAMSAMGEPMERITTFDTDSHQIGMDNRSSACISHQEGDFIPGTLRKCHRTIKGYAGRTVTNNIWIGTLMWPLQDDNGVTHRFPIPGNYLCKEGGMRLFSPQHWAKVMKDKNPHGTGAWTSPSQVVLYWKGRKYKKTIPLDPHSNVADMYLAPGYSRYTKFCQSMCVDPETLPAETNVVVDPAIIPPDEEDQSSANVPQDLSDDWQEEKPLIPREFNLSRPPTETEREHAPQIITDEEDVQEMQSTPAAELLRYHQRFGHLSFKKLEWMARKGIIPKNLATCKPPFCSSCAYAKATRKPWRSRGRMDQPKLVPITKPGQVVSVDQLVSPAPGLIAQMTGFLMTRKRYRYATVFVDHFSGLGFVYLQKTASADETIEAKKAFERCAADRNVTIHAYHADNGIFKAHDWVVACMKQNQALTFAGVGAHHQNGKAEKRIRDLQDMTRTILMHANRKRPKAITIALWPYALRHANSCINATPSLQNMERMSPIQLCESHNVEINPKHWHPFGCPVYVLTEPLQAGAPFHKWKVRARVGVNLGQSPIHNQNVALVLNLDTGHVSPQFHVKFDNSFTPRIRLYWSPSGNRKLVLNGVLPS